MRARSLSISSATMNVVDVVVDGMAAVRDSAADFRRAAVHAALVLCFALAIAGCGGGAGNSSSSAAGAERSYTVQPGDTVYHIASRFGVSVGRLMTANGLSDPRELRVGQTLTIPGTHAVTMLSGRAHGFSNAMPYSGMREARQFAWPVAHGVVSSGFGIRNGAMHDGVDIAAPAGTPVLAADNGVVVFAGTLHGYGNTVIIQHDDHYATVYGHDERNFVREGDHVSRGQMIGEIGRSGRTTGANLHFEVRHDNLARNPLAFLPEPPAAPGITYAAGERM
ncbi:MAG: M23 family metallopeptidase [Candidatus Binataceae bacterium]